MYPINVPHSVRQFHRSGYDRYWLKINRTPHGPTKNIKIIPRRFETLPFALLCVLLKIAIVALWVRKKIGD